MSSIKSVAFITAAALLVAFAFIGCEGEQGPAGPPGPPGPPGDTLGLSYLGNNASACGHCHSDLVEAWEATGHADAWTALGEANQSNLYCVQCHTTGFDDRYDHDRNRISEGQDLNGYDDNPRAALYGVQCEACHGPMGPNPADHAPQIQAALRGDGCGACHPAYDEYLASGHGTAIDRAGGQSAWWTEFGRGPCWDCHVSERFISLNDPGSGLATNSSSWQVTCATCHDPHSSTNAGQLRNVGNVTSPYGGEDAPDGYVISGWGAGQLCVQCHHARRSRSNIMAQINNGSAHPGPHPSSQGDMVAGRGSYEIPGYTYPRTMLHQTSFVADMCVTCHIVTRGFDNPQGPAYGHTFEPQLAKCQQCHASATNFDVGGVQTEVANLMEQLEDLLPQDSTGHVAHVMDTLNWTRPQREAGYAYFFVYDDKSHGVHNRDYTIALLTNAINYLVSAIAEEKYVAVRH